jgi:zinc/manganese transport system permease protein
VSVLASAADPSLFKQVFNFDDYGPLLSLEHNSVIAGAVLGVVCGLISAFVMTRDLPFAVHGISELSFAGAAAALLAGISVVAGSLLGSLVAALVIGVMGVRARDRNAIIGVLMPFGLGLGVLFLALYHGRASDKFGLLIGQVASVDSPELSWLVGISVVVVAALLIMWRPLTFASLDADVAAARGVPVRLLSPVFMVVLGMVVAMSVQIVGALLVLSIVCTPAAAAYRVTASPLRATVLSVVFATTATVGGILLALGSLLPITPYITSVSFAIYVGCRIIERVRGHARPINVPARLPAPVGAGVRP